MIEIRILNLILICVGFVSLMWAFVHQVKCLKIQFTGSRMAKFYFLMAALGFSCYEIWNLRYESGNTVAVWNCWAILIAYLLTKYHPFSERGDEKVHQMERQ